MKRILIVMLMIVIISPLFNCEDCEPFSVTIEKVAVEECGNRIYVRAISNPYEGVYFFDVYDLEGNLFSQPLDEPMAERDWYLPPGNYFVKVTHMSSDCVVRQDFILEPVVLFSTEEIVINPKRCPPFNDGSVTVKINGGNPPYNITLDNQPIEKLTENEFRFNEVMATRYSLNVVDAWGCRLNKTFAVGFDEVFSFQTELRNSATNCNSGAINIINLTGGTPPYKVSVSRCSRTGPRLSCIEIRYYQKDGSATFIENLDPTPYYNYDIMVRDSNGCMSIKSVKIESSGVESTLFFDQTTVANTGCILPNGQIHLTATGGTPPYSFQVAEVLTSYSGPDRPGTVISAWSSTSSFSNLTNAKYWVYAKDDAGCTLEQRVIISNGASTLTFSHSSMANTNCLAPNGGLTVSPEGGEPPYSFQIALSNPASIVAPWSSSLTYANLNDVSYDVSIKDALGCIATKIIEIPHGNTNVSYVTDVQPLFTMHCNTTGCHDGTLGATTDFRDRLIIKSKGDQIISYIANKTMPPPSYPYSVPLGDDKIKLITCWIKDGCPDN